MEKIAGVPVSVKTYVPDFKRGTISESVENSVGFAKWARTASDESVARIRAGPRDLGTLGPPSESVRKNAFERSARALTQKKAVGDFRQKRDRIRRDPLYGSIDEARSKWRCETFSLVFESFPETRF